MNRDLTEILAEWPYDPSKVNVRLIQGREGEPIIQIRLDLGILQLCYDGRPDGQTINGYPSLLEYFEARLDGHEPDEEVDPEAPAEGGPARRGPAREEAAGSDGPEATGEVDPAGAGGVDEDEPAERAPGDRRELALTPEDCRALRDEAAQYYHRYVALLILEDFEGVVRDTTRNLRVLDLCAQHAVSEDDRATLEQFRPYIMMMRARALASQALRDNEAKAAVVAIDEGIEALRKYYSERAEPEAFASSNEVQALQEMREALVPKLPASPPSQAAELRRRLQRAIDQENYELAAILRDEIRLLADRGGGAQA